MAMLKANFEIETPSLIEDAIQFIDEIYTKIEEEEKKGQHFQDIQGDVFEYLLKATNAASHFPIYIRITIDGKRLEFSTKKFVDSSKWSPELSRMKGNSEEASSLMIP